MADKSAYSLRSMSELSSPKKRKKTVILKPPDDNQRPGRKIIARKCNTLPTISTKLILTTDERRKYIIREKAKLFISLRKTEVNEFCKVQKQSRQPLPKRAQRIANLAIPNCPLWTISNTITEDKTNYYAKFLENIKNSTYETTNIPLSPSHLNLSGGFFQSDEKINIKISKSINEEKIHKCPKNKAKVSSSKQNSLSFNKRQHNVEDIANSSKAQDIKCNSRIKVKVKNKSPLDQCKDKLKKSSQSKRLIREKQSNQSVQNKQKISSASSKHIQINQSGDTSHRYLFRSDHSLRSTCNIIARGDSSSDTSTNSPIKCTRSKSLIKNHSEPLKSIRSLNNINSDTSTSSNSPVKCTRSRNLIKNHNAPLKGIQILNKMSSDTSTSSNSPVKCTRSMSLIKNHSEPLKSVRILNNTSKDVSQGRIKKSKNSLKDKSFTNNNKSSSKHLKCLLRNHEKKIKTKKPINDCSKTSYSQFLCNMNIDKSLKVDKNLESNDELFNQFFSDKNKSRETERMNIQSKTMYTTSYLCLNQNKSIIKDELSKIGKIDVSNKEFANSSLTSLDDSELTEIDSNCDKKCNSCFNQDKSLDKVDAAEFENMNISNEFKNVSSVILDKSLETNRKCGHNNGSYFDNVESLKSSQSVKLISDESFRNYSRESLEPIYNSQNKTEDNFCNVSTLNNLESESMAPSGTWSDFQSSEQSINISISSEDKVLSDYVIYEDDDIANEIDFEDGKPILAIPSYFTDESSNSQTSFLFSTPKDKRIKSDTPQKSSFQWSSYKLNDEAYSDVVLVHTSRTDSDNSKVKTSVDSSLDRSCENKQSSSDNFPSSNDDIPSQQKSCFQWSTFKSKDGTDNDFVHTSRRDSDNFEVKTSISIDSSLDSSCEIKQSSSCNFPSSDDDIPSYSTLSNSVLSNVPTYFT